MARELIVASMSTADSGAGLDLFDEHDLERRGRANRLPAPSA